MINSRAKGAGGELELCKLLREYGFEAIRSQQHCGAAGDEDIIHNIKDHFIECKRYGSTQPDRFFYEAYKKAESDNVKRKKYICIFYRYDYHEWQVYTAVNVFDARINVHMLAKEYLPLLEKE